MQNTKYLFWIFFLFACGTDTKPEFIDWYEQNSTPQSGIAKEHQVSFYSSPLKIDTIYRSMQGPYEIKKVNIDTKSDELIWITSYRSKVEKVEPGTNPLSDQFMCHNNLNYSAQEEIPWKIKTSGADSRIFTLSEGQTELIFPEGFGIPVPADLSLEMVSQVLNHKEKNIDINSRHHVTFSYIKDSELNSPLKPLYQQSVFVTKQIAGPAGDYGLPKLCREHHLDSLKIKGKTPKHDCSVDISREDYNPYRDKQGRKYTGHWTLPYGKEELTTDVTQMLDLKEDSRIHMIGLHLHPFAEGLELWDKTTDSLLYAGAIKSKADGFGFDSISYYSSREGIPVYQDHRYELKSIYNCTDSSEKHTAMAVMYLYLADR